MLLTLSSLNLPSRVVWNIISVCLPETILPMKSLRMTASSSIIGMYCFLRLCSVTHKRKNWLFAGSPKGAESSCAIYSLVETAKQNGLNPYEYLRKVFTMVPLINNREDWEQLLPWNIQLD